VEELALARGELGARQGGGLGELAGREQELARAAVAAPLRRRLLDARDERPALGLLDQPAGEGLPAAHQRLVGDLVAGPLRRLAGDQEAPAHQRVERAARVRRQREELLLEPAGAGPLDGDQPQEQRARRRALVAAEQRQERVGVARQRPLAPAEAVEPGAPRDPALLAAPLPQRVA